MVYIYSLTITDQDGNVVLDHDLSADQAVEILAEALKQRPTQPAAQEDEPEQTPAPRAAKKAKSAAKKPLAAEKPERKQGKTRARVVALRVQGKSPQQIADALGISYSAVKYHLAKDEGESLGAWGTRSPKQDKAATPQEDALAEDQFDELKNLQKIGDLSSKEFAADKHVALSEVNRAIASLSYQDYRDF